MTQRQDEIAELVEEVKRYLEEHYVEQEEVLQGPPTEEMAVPVL